MRYNIEEIQSETIEVTRDERPRLIMIVASLEIKAYQWLEYRVTLDLRYGRITVEAVHLAGIQERVVCRDRWEGRLEQAPKWALNAARNIA